MSTSATAIWIIIAVVVACLAVWLAAVALAARKPYHDGPRQRQRWRVQGGTHIARGGRSVAPRRDEPVTQETEDTGR